MKTIVVWLANPEIACLNFSPAHQSRLRAAVPDARVRVCESRVDFLEQLPEAEIALVWHFDQAWFARAPRLRLLSTPSAGHEEVDVHPPENVRLHYGAFQGYAMAETVVGMMLSACRGILRATWVRNEDPWPREVLDREMRTLRDAHIVIVGFGHIGRWIGRLAKGFGARITGVKRRPPEGHPAYFDAKDRVVTGDTLDEVLPDADHVVLCLPGQPDTDQLLDRRRLGLLPSSAWIYNVGRGNAIDEEALADALHRGELGGACLDVFQREPLPPDARLRTAPNVLCMPHSSAFAPGYMDAYLDEVLPLLAGERGRRAQRPGQQRGLVW